MLLSSILLFRSRFSRKHRSGRSGVWCLSDGDGGGDDDDDDDDAADHDDDDDDSDDGADEDLWLVTTMEDDENLLCDFWQLLFLLFRGNLREFSSGFTANRVLIESFSSFVRHTFDI